MDYKILFAGSGEFGATILEKLAGSKFRPLAVITQPDKPIGRKQIPSPSRAKKIALEFGLETLEPKSLKSNEAEEIIKKYEPDLIVVADYGKIIPKNILDIPKFGAINIHPSSLPRHRGATPIQHTILEGDKETGVTIILMDEQVDHGKILNQKSGIKIQNLGYIELLKNLAEVGGDLILETIPPWLAGEIKPVTQDESRATYTKILTRENGKINWQKSAEEINRQVKAFEGWPGAWCVWPEENKKLKILSAEISKQNLYDHAGQVSVSPDGEMLITTREGALKINELQLEGKAKITGQEFLRGYPKIVESILS
ncbi:methionyl-tRNA formyltransferase [Patescibacteria group bacterium]|nr:methionyl-tRNA formyltransferase [Patescibacteria group bacterium]